MSKVYVTFGQQHVHRINNHTLDKDCIAVIRCGDYSEGRAHAFCWFKGEFHECFSQTEWDKNKDNLLQYYPRGLIQVN